MTTKSTTNGNLTGRSNTKSDRSRFRIKCRRKLNLMICSFSKDVLIIFNYIRQPLRNCTNTNHIYSLLQSCFSTCKNCFFIMYKKQLTFDVLTTTIQSDGRKCDFLFLSKFNIFRVFLVLLLTSVFVSELTLKPFANAT